MNDETCQVTLSYELLHLMQWLIEHEPEKIKSIIAQAMEDGLKDELKTLGNSAAREVSETVRYSVVDFLELLEVLLQEVSNEHTLKSVLEKKLMPAFDHIDSTACDIETVQTSVEQASSQFERNPKKNPQELLFKELLRTWKPNKKSLAN